MQIKEFHDDRTGTMSYVVYDENSKDAVIIDPVLDLDTFGWRTFNESLDNIEAFCKGKNLNVHWALDTHIHADHLTGTAEIKARFGAKVGINENVVKVQEIFKGIFNIGDEFKSDGHQFDQLFKDGDVIEAGTIKIDVMHTPGHTPACLTYKIDDAVFVGDVMFMPDIGVARCDFPEGSAEKLYDSVMNKLYTLPDETRLYTGHDYPEGRELKFMATIGECKAQNKDLPEGTDKEAFVKKINDLDATRPAPRLLFPSLQVNIRAGHLPEPEDNNVSYMKFPINFL